VARVQPNQKKKKKKGGELWVAHRTKRKKKGGENHCSTWSAGRGERGERRTGVGTREAPNLREKKTYKRKRGGNPLWAGGRGGGKKEMGGGGGRRKPILSTFT